MSRPSGYGGGCRIFLASTLSGRCMGVDIFQISQYFYGLRVRTLNMNAFTKHMISDNVKLEEAIHVITSVESRFWE